MLIPERRRPGARKAVAAEELRALLDPGDDSAKTGLDDHLLQVLDPGAIARAGLECGRCIEGESVRQAGKAAIAFDEGAAGVG